MMRRVPKTVENAIGITMKSLNSGSNTPPFRRLMKRQTISETFPANEDPNIPPIKGATYNNPTDNDDILYGLVSTIIRSRGEYGA